MSVSQSNDRPVLTAGLAALRNLAVPGVEVSVRPVSAAEPASAPATPQRPNGILGAFTPGEIGELAGSMATALVRVGFKMAEQAGEQREAQQKHDAEVAAAEAEKKRKEEESRLHAVNDQERAIQASVERYRFLHGSSARKSEPVEAPIVTGNGEIV